LNDIFSKEFQISQFSSNSRSVSRSPSCWNKATWSGW